LEFVYKVIVKINGIKIHEINKKYIHMKKEDREFIAKALKITRAHDIQRYSLHDMNEGTDLMKKGARWRGNVAAS
jgi:hypothetical protein